mmetsp:Transcript_13739/g.26356  ORF Transcript_13739/g.26356 Transcript_13739/m.26356 type:complete len:259 (+) Transcript_13739:406-1182(+)|eukprot:CAMPEP_0114241554 /NCGR_PEP_ID=MMETSP0058-20121206/9691_1 /TAXON_ID=36894 /ORGANISM="Pyramimonas parkeae, CCMP726" /LENGTH=258 /DNA_ID=CAMNT_0001354081 /DNA_START=384 /DNA_END=1160 /DNA_ORIENTATION=-
MSASGPRAHSSDVTSPAAEPATSKRSQMRGVEREWEELRKDARKLESELDVKLVSFSKVGQGVGEAVLQGERPSEMLGGKVAELEALLQRLSDVNEAMGSAVRGAGLARMHTVARHRDILDELTHEFNRTRALVKSGLQRDALLGGRVQGTYLGGMGDSSGSTAGSTAHLLRERNSINSSVSHIDQIIHQAQATMNTLSGQQSLFTGMSSKIHKLGTRFPLVNTLLGTIKRKRSKDTLIMSAVIAMCSMFMFVYWLSK